MFNVVFLYLLVQRKYLKIFLFGSTFCYFRISALRVNKSIYFRNDYFIVYFKFTYLHEKKIVKANHMIGKMRYKML